MDRRLRGYTGVAEDAAGWFPAFAGMTKEAGRDPDWEDLYAGLL